MTAVVATDTGGPRGLAWRSALGAGAADALALGMALLLGAAPVTALLLGFRAAWAWWTLARGRAAPLPAVRDRVALALGGAQWLLLRGALVAALWQGMGLPFGVAAVVAVLATVLAARGLEPLPRPWHWSPALFQAALPGLLLAFLALRWGYGLAMEPVADEAYHSLWARHLDWGYVDHPGMVAWLIWLSTAVFGDSTFALRLPAFLGGLVTLLYLWRLAREMYGPAAARGAALLVVILPGYVLSGTVMMPDAAFIPAWTAALFYLWRALLHEQAGAWIGVGIAGGIALSSKYTAGLLAPATLAFMLADARARRQLLQPGPWLAAAIGALLFTPTVIWNLQHDWVSFSYQGSRRWSSGEQGYLLKFGLQVLLMLSPPALLALLLNLGSPGEGARSRRRSWFIASFVLVPLSVFVFYSFGSEPQEHWTSPVWLAALPLLGALLPGGERAISRAARWLRPVWAPTIVLLFVAYGATLHYVTLGWPGVPTVWHRVAFQGWGETATLLHGLEQDIERRSGQRPLIVATSKWSVAAQLGHHDVDGRIDNLTARNALGESGVMFEQWLQRPVAADRPILLVDFNRCDLDDLGHRRRYAALEGLGPVRCLRVERDGRWLRDLCYRTASSLGALGR